MVATTDKHLVISKYKRNFLFSNIVDPPQTLPFESCGNLVLKKHNLIEFLYLESYLFYAFITVNYLDLHL
jgi:hypothetical protein